MPNVTYARTQGQNRFGRRRYSRYVTKGYLKAVVGVPESKYLDTVVGSQVDTIPRITLLNAIAPGTTSNTRIGNQVSNKSLHIRLSLNRGNYDAYVRVIIFWWKDGVAGPTAADILQDVSGGIANYQSPLNKNNGKSFWVRFDRTYALAAGQTQLQVDEIWRRLKCQSEYNTPETNTFPDANSLNIMFVASPRPLTPPNPVLDPTYNFYSRLTYLDV